MLVNKLSAAQLQILSESLGLPPWLLEAIIIEYLPCRRYDLDKFAVVIDYALVSESLLQSLPRPCVLLNGPLLMHNVTPDVARNRLFLGAAYMLGARIFPVATLAEHPSMSIPDGKVSPHNLRFPHRQERDSDIDEKRNLNIFGYALVIDEDGLYQWQIAEEAHSLASYRSEVIPVQQLSELGRLNAALDAIPFPNTDADRATCASEFEALYKELEQVRSMMRAAVLTYHLTNKGTPEALRGYSEQEPPELTAVDQFTVRQGTIKVRTFIEPLFFRAAHRAIVRANAARGLVVSGTHVSIYIAEEIEAAAEAIALSAMCLEAYINGFAQDHLPQLDDLLQTLDFKAKWRLFPGLLGHPDCFATDRMPYQGFNELVRWRNHVLVHYKHEFSASAPLAGRQQMATYVHHVCNADNAQRAIDTVVEMVRQITTCCGFEPPDWVQDTVLNGGWLRAEDLAVVPLHTRHADEVTLPTLSIRADMQTHPEGPEDNN